MNATFKKWMEASGCVFWFGCSSDKTADDKTKGTGYKWAWDNGKLNLYPFVRVWWKAGKVDECQNGDYWTGGSSKGYNTFISKLKTLLKNFKPNASTEDKPSTDNGGCDGDACNVDTSSLKKELDSLKSEFNAFTKEFTSKIEALSNKIG
jgi:hypothetical protein